MRLTIRKKVISIGLLGLATSAILGGVGSWSIYRLSESITTLRMYTSALSNQEDADMMHDALRGDVYRALLETEETAQTNIRNELEEHAQTLRDRIAANEALDLGAEVEKTITKAKPVLEAYVRAAQNILEAVARDRSEATGHRTAFQAAFANLEEQMGHLSEVIRSAHDAESANCGQLSGRSQNIMLVAWLVAVVVLSGAAFLATRSITQPITALISRLTDIAEGEGDLTERVDENRQDELGDLGRLFNTFVAKIRKAIQSIAENAQVLASASEELAAVSNEMTKSADQTAEQINSVSHASDQVNQSVQTMAAGSEQMAASVKEISKSAAEAAKIVGAAVRIAQATNQSMTQLGESSAEINDVVKLINSIAEQTNLLALNASIEAARAGETGKGFAVVANEVKELAKATASSTSKIGTKVQGIQTDTKEAVTAIAEITKVINQVNDLAATIASAVEEQTATTGEMGRNLTHAAQGTSEIASSVSHVVAAAKSTTSGATDTQKAASEIARMGSELQQLVGQFKY